VIPLVSKQAIDNKKEPLLLMATLSIQGTMLSALTNVKCRWIVMRLCAHTVAPWLIRI